MTTCFFVSDLHGQINRYQKLFKAITKEHPSIVFIGGDILPSGLISFTSIDSTHKDFINDFLAANLKKLQKKLKDAYPRIFLILGNDDTRFEEAAILDAATSGIWEYLHNRKAVIGDYSIYGYSYVPPTPFQLKDWERYDVSRYVDPGCISPEEGYHSIPVLEYELKYSTIQKDLELLIGKNDPAQAVFLFHAPPYKTNLDRAALDGKMIDYVPLDVHVGSIAIKRFIETYQPLITLHGHIHETVSLTGTWKDKIGKTYSFSAAHSGEELSLVRFELEKPAKASRQLI